MSWHINLKQHTYLFLSGNYMPGSSDWVPYEEMSIEDLEWMKDHIQETGGFDLKFLDRIRRRIEIEIQHRLIKNYVFSTPKKEAQI